MSILRCVDRRFETGEIFIKWDESDDEEWLLLIYIKNNSPDEGIVIEDKTNSEKNISHEFQNNEIFKRPVSPKFQRPEFIKNKSFEGLG